MKKTDSLEEKKERVREREIVEGKEWSRWSGRGKKRDEGKREGEIKKR
jgi:hypothetical protein